MLNQINASNVSNSSPIVGKTYDFERWNLDTTFFHLFFIIVWFLSIRSFIRSTSFKFNFLSHRFLVYTHHHSPIVDQANQDTLRSILEKSCPSLVGPDAYFSPTPWLFSGHLQTIYSAFGNFSKIDLVEYERRIIRVPDGGQIALDFSPPNRFSNKNDPTPTLIVLHGLTGGSHESYVRSVISPLIKNFGWRSVVANFRGCAGSQLTSQKLYNAGATEDIRSIIKFLITHVLCPLTPLHAIGFSLGANVLAKYLGEEGDRCLIRSAVVVGNPWDLYAGHCFLESSFIGRFYSRALASNLRAVMKRHLQVFKTRSSLIDLHALFANPAQSLYEFDSIVTRALGRFKSTEAYYKSQSSIHAVEKINIPLLSINAIDDPIVTIDSIPVESVLENPYLVIMVSRHGGHLGWFEGSWNPKRMIHRPILEWFKSMNQAIQFNPKLNLDDSFVNSHHLNNDIISSKKIEVVSVQDLSHSIQNDASVLGTIQGL